MRKLLVATDFTKAGKNASDFAALLCKHIGAEMVLFHSYRIPVPVNESAMIAVNYADMEEEVMELLKSEATRLRLESGVHIEIRLAPGFAVQEIGKLQKELKADLVVMGIMHSGVVSDYLLGSITTSFMNEAQVPLLVVPDGVKFSRPRSILFACDYDEKTNASVLEPLKEIATLFDSRVFILNIVKNEKDFKLEKSISGIKLDEYLNTINHLYYFSEDGDAVEGISEFISTHDVNWVVMVPHHHHWYERILNKSKTRRYLFQANKAVLVIPAN